MMKFNLLPRYRLEHVIPGAPFSRVIVTGQELTRLNLFVCSFNATISHVRTGMPDVYEKACDHHSLKDIIDERGIQTLKHGSPLRHRHVLVHRVDSEVWQRSVHSFNEFLHNQLFPYDRSVALYDVPFFPNSLMIMEARDSAAPKIGAGTWSSSVYELVPEEMIKLGLLNPCVVLSASDIQRARQVYREMDRAKPDRYRLKQIYFRRVWRPLNRVHEEALFAVCSYKGGPSSVDGITRVATDGYHDSTAPVFTDELDVLMEEGRIVPLWRDGERPEYVTKRILLDRLSCGEAVKVRIDGTVKYVASANLGGHVDEYGSTGVGKSDVREAFLQSVRDGRVRSSMRHSAPLLSLCIDIANSSPHASERFMDAARIAAEHHAPNYAMTSLLLYEHLYGQSEYAHVFKGHVFEDFVRDRCRREGIDLRHVNRWTGNALWVASIINEADSFDLDKYEMHDASGMHTALQDFFDIFCQTPDQHFMSFEKSFALAYYAFVLSGLKRCENGDVSDAAIRKFRAIVIPMAERMEYQAIADEMRNELFRITNPDEYRLAEQAIEKIFGFKRDRLKGHLRYSAETVHALLAKMGIYEASASVTHRVKSPYSLWEKMNSFGVDDLLLMWDILGISVVVETDKRVYDVANALDQIFPDIDAHRAPHFAPLLTFLESVGRRLYNDQIARPRPSGFSAVTLLKCSQRDVPIEIQVTSKERHKTNVEGRAAHWKHKVKREIEALYGITVHEIGDINDHDDEPILI